MSNLNPYLSFDGTAREAMTFYQSVFAGELNLMTFGENGGLGLPESEHDKVMHGQIDKDGRPFLMGADLPGTMDFVAAAGITVALSGSDEAELTGWWEALTEGATIGEPLAKAPWGDSFGMLTDRFGTPWMVNISGQGQGQGQG